MGDQVAAAVNTFKELAEIPSVSSAEIVRSSDGERKYDVKFNLSARSYATMAKSTQRCNLSLLSGKVISSSFSPAVDNGDDTIKGSISSLPGSKIRWTVILREVMNKEGKTKRLVELWKGERRYKYANVTNHHGAFVTHNYYGTLSTHDDAILYSAEANSPSKTVDISSRKSKDTLNDWEYKPGLGEQTGGMVQPTIFLLRFNLSNNEGPTLSKLSAKEDGSDQALSTAIFGQAVFSSTGKDILVTAYPTLLDGRRLGVTFCTNYPSIVYRASIEKGSGGKIDDKDAIANNPWYPQKWLRLSMTGFSARSPRSVGVEGDCFFLQSEEGGAHRDCDALVYSTKGQMRIEVPFQQCPDRSTRWAGLYSDAQLPRSCLLNTLGGLVTDTILDCSKIIILIKFESQSAPIDLTPTAQDLEQSAIEKKFLWNYRVLCTDGEDTILAVRSAPQHPDQLLMGVVEPDGNKAKWSIIHRIASQWEKEKAFEALAELECSIETISGTSDSLNKGDEDIQAILLRKSGLITPGPFILVPHGGPHSSFLTQWEPSLAALCLEGYTLALPNYHGSLGRGQQFAHSLLGKCGQRDVDDCVKCVRHFVSTGVADENQLFITGGSHGGFLTVHLIGKYPTLFQKAAVRNPVIAAATMEATTDIPHWCYAEFGHSFPYERPPPFIPTANQYNELQQYSPIHQVDDIQTPLLILLGLKDQRVPPAQSKLLYHRLKATKKAVKMLAFEEDNHSLDGVETEIIAWESVFRWFE